MPEKERQSLKGSANLSLFQDQHVTFPLRMSGRAERGDYLLQWLGGGLFVSGGEARHQTPVENTSDEASERR